MATSKKKLHLCLGIDFGTKYTKVCFRDLARRKSKIVAFKEYNQMLDDAMIPSVLISDGVDRYQAGMTCTEYQTLLQQGKCKSIEYIKMRLADLDAEDSKNIDIYAPLQGPGDKKTTTEAACAFFLCQVIRKAKRYITLNEPELLKGVDITWSANIGVPVEYYDSPAIMRFRRVFASAWVLSERIDLVGDTATMQEIVQAYERVRDVDPEKQNCSAIPEIGAAVQSFLTSRSAQEGVYVYADIGAGTLDGVSFRYYRQDGFPKINYYAGKVQPLGLNALANRIANFSNTTAPAEYYEKELFEGDLLSHIKLAKFRTDVQKVVAEVVVFGKRLDPNGFSRGVHPTYLPIFIGGGGARSQSYQNAILATYNEFQHASIGIPQYRTMNNPVPDDLDLNGLSDDDYYRFSVAYGLTPVGEMADFKLPSEMTRYAHQERMNRVPRERRTCRFCNSYPMPGDTVCFAHGDN